MSQIFSAKSSVTNEHKSSEHDGRSLSYFTSAPLQCPRAHSIITATSRNTPIVQAIIRGSAALIGASIAITRLKADGIAKEVSWSLRRKPPSQSVFQTAGHAYLSSVLYEHGKSLGSRTISGAATAKAAKSATALERTVVVFIVDGWKVYFCVYTIRKTEDVGCRTLLVFFVGAKEKRCFYIFLLGLLGSVSV